RLVTGVGAALGKGDPVIVVGHTYTSEYEDRDGIRRSTLEMRASSVGPDLARSIVRIIDKTSGKDADSAPTPEASTPENGVDEAADKDHAAESNAKKGGKALALSA